MSENLDLVRSIFAAWSRGDYSSADWAHPDVKFVAADGPATGTWSGMIGLSEATRDAIDSLDDARIQPEDYRELDGERVLVLVRYSGRGKASGLDLEQMRSEGAWIVHVCDGRITRFVRYWDRNRALADVGLAPEGGSSGTDRPR
ncbi:MAG TPA: nuclear transport factor 2 family protein [Solirubrobacteraceae bacterium]|jgi:ketosteroid isomerase-like protein|nr:nuclear transport factor 2 family protein [Solirubrobacteraceae bacterium]